MALKQAPGRFPTDEEQLIIVGDLRRIHAGEIIHTGDGSGSGWIEVLQGAAPPVMKARTQLLRFRFPVADGRAREHADLQVSQADKLRVKRGFIVPTGLALHLFATLTHELHLPQSTIRTMDQTPGTELIMIPVIGWPPRPSL